MMVEYLPGASTYLDTCLCVVEAGSAAAALLCARLVITIAIPL